MHTSSVQYAYNTAANVQQTNSTSTAAHNRHNKDRSTKQSGCSFSETASMIRRIMRPDVHFGIRNYGRTHLSCDSIFTFAADDWKNYDEFLDERQRDWDWTASSKTV